MADNITDLAAGTAGEHLVAADLLLQGYRAFLADQNCPFDVALEVRGEGLDRLVRVQVKTTRQPRAIPQRVGHHPAYMWHVRRTGKRGERRYGEDDFDLLALVALDIRQIAYLPLEQVKQTIHIRTDEEVERGNKPGKTFADYQFADALQAVLVRGAPL